MSLSSRVNDVFAGICGPLGRTFGSAGRSDSLSSCRWVTAAAATEKHSAAKLRQM